MMAYVVIYEDKKNNKFYVIGVNSTLESAKARIKSKIERYSNKYYYDYTENELEEIEKNYNIYCVPQGE